MLDFLLSQVGGLDATLDPWRIAQRGHSEGVLGIRRRATAASQRFSGSSGAKSFEPSGTDGMLRGSDDLATLTFQNMLHLSQVLMVEST